MLQTTQFHGPGPGSCRTFCLVTVFLPFSFPLGSNWDFVRPKTDPRSESHAGPGYPVGSGVFEAVLFKPRFHTFMKPSRSTIKLITVVSQSLSGLLSLEPGVVISSWYVSTSYPTRFTSFKFGGTIYKTIFSYQKLLHSKREPDLIPSSEQEWTILKSGRYIAIYIPIRYPCDIAFLPTFLRQPIPIRF